MAFEEYIKVLKKGGDKFPPKYIVAKHKDAIFAALRKAQYLGCLHKLPNDLREFIDEVDALVNDMTNYKPGPAAMASNFGAPINEPCAYCGSTKGTYSGKETAGHQACIECGGI